MSLVTIKDLILTEVNGLFGTELIKDLNDTIKCYEYYEGTHDDLIWNEEWSMDFETTKKNHNFIKELIGKQNRFMFGFTPQFECLTDDEDTTITEYINEVLEDNRFSSKLLKAELDCSIGKRVAIKFSVDEKAKKIRLRFVNSLEFVYETADDDSEDITKVIFFYQTNDKELREDQRIFKQVYEMQNGVCYCEEGIYNGLGELVEERRKRSSTGLNFMPVYVILNGGLSGDLKGTSDVNDLLENQRDYNRLDSGDSDALIKGMFESLYGVNLSEESASGIKKAPGMFYDIQIDPATRDQGGSVEMGVLSYTFSYVEALERHLMRNKQAMYGVLDIPQVSPAELQGFITSGKGMKALYWQLIVRCEAKMMEWKPALRWMVNTIIEISRTFNIASVPDKEFRTVVTTRYALPEDKETEMANDLLKVNAKSMSIKDFIVKWEEVTPEAAEEILDQIVKEKQLLEESYMNMQ